MPEITNEQRVKMAKLWAAANGYKGRKGGWIYSAAGRVICQGWITFYYNFSRSIIRDIPWKGKDRS